MTLAGILPTESPRQPHLLYGGKAGGEYYFEHHHLRTTVQLLLIKGVPFLKVMP